MKNSTPLISVLMPAYNAEKYIAEAIESILNQTLKDFEFIIIDDCSTDKTWNIIQKYAKGDGRIKARKNEENLGIAGNRNKLVKAATGQYIVWQDADDISLPSRISELLKKMRSDETIGICGSYIEMFEEEEIIGLRKYAETDELLRKKIFRYSPVAQPAAMIRKECFNKVGLYNLKMPPAEDIEMSFRIGTIYKFANVPMALLKYRVHSTSATSTKLRIIERNTLKVRKLFSNNRMYKMSTQDKIYNKLQELTMNLMPAKIRIGLFNFIRTKI